MVVPGSTPRGHTDAPTSSPPTLTAAEQRALLGVSGGHPRDHDPVGRLGHQLPPAEITPDSSP